MVYVDVKHHETEEELIDTQSVAARRGVEGGGKQMYVSVTR